MFITKIKNMMKTKSRYTVHYIIKNIIIALLIFAVSSIQAFSARIKDIATVQGVSGTQVIGYGLVTGLNNTGDNQMSSYSVQSVINMLKRFGITPPETSPRVRNVAAVMVTSTVPSFMKKGSKVDVQVSSIGDAKSLQGGILLMSPLSISDGTIVGMAQGALSVGGYDYQSLGSRSGKNFVTSGRVPNGLILEQDVQAYGTANIVNNQTINILLRDPDFTTAANVASAINGSNLGNARQIDAGTIEVTLPTANNSENMQSIANIEVLQVNADVAARVVINERTGTIVVGGNVQLLPTVVAHGNLEITIQRNVVIPQPAPFTIRPPSPVETADVTTKEQKNPVSSLAIPAGATVQDMVNALNALQLAPRDLIAIFQALKSAGALQGELIIQ